MAKLWPMRKSRSMETVFQRKLTKATSHYTRLTGEVNAGYGSHPSDRNVSPDQCQCPSDDSYICDWCRNEDLNGEIRTVQTGTISSSRRRMSITVTDSGEHCHDDEAQKEIDKRARKKLWLASILCVIFMIVESVGGILAGSLAVATDAAHLLTDFAGFMISLFALYISERPATKRLSYGYHRAEVIGALTSVLLIWVVTGILIYMAIQRIVNEEYEIDAEIMLITSGVGLIVNIIMGCTLHQHAHTHGGGGHGHGHSHGNNPIPTPTNQPKIETRNGVSLDIEERGEEGISDDSSDGSSTAGSPEHVHKPNINVRAAFIHVIGDFLQSVGVFIAALVIFFKPEWSIVDPICTFLFSILVLGTTYAIVTDTIVVLMEGIPKGIKFNDVRETLLGIKGVHKVHNLRIWSLSMDRMALSAHLAIVPASKYSGSQILRKSSQRLRTKYGFSEVTIQIEDFSEKMDDCIKCKELN